MDLFKTWNDDVLKEVAEEGRNIQYLADRVIEMDTTETEFVYIISKVIFLFAKFRSINFRKTNISYLLIRTRTCAYQGVRNVCFSEILACFAFLKHPF